jgi:hypothetical protein
LKEVEDRDKPVSVEVINGIIRRGIPVEVLEDS